MNHFWLISPCMSALDPKKVRQALRDQGYPADLVMTKQVRSALTFEIALGPNLSRVIVDLSGDVKESIGDLEVVRELVQEEEARGIRRLMHVRAWEHADAQAVESLIRIICQLMSAYLPPRQSW